jgi:hypothetical protein
MSTIDIPQPFKCPITSLVMHDPVVTICGDTYEREAIETWFKRNNTNPLTNE